MLKIQRFVCNMLQENCYVVSDETQECVIVDCGAYYPEEKEAISLYIEENQLKPVHLLATHGHLDHNFGNGFIYEKYGLSVELHGDDLEFITNTMSRPRSSSHSLSTILFLPQDACWPTTTSSSLAAIA